MLWLRWRPFSARVEVLRRKQGAYSGIKAVCFLICIGRDAPFGAKPPQAGSHKSLMYLTESEELFYHKGCKFAFVGVDQTRRRSLRGASTPWFPLFIAGALQLRKLRRFACKPELKDDQVGAWLFVLCVVSYRRRQKQQAVFGTLGSKRGRTAFDLSPFS